MQENRERDIIHQIISIYISVVEKVKLRTLNGPRFYDNIHHPVRIWALSLRLSLNIFQKFILVLNRHTPRKSQYLIDHKL
jgi:hypothetical protein